MIPARCRVVLERCRGEGLRCAATRRHTLRTGADSGSEDLEKTGCFIVMISNNCRVFWCSVNWARARPETTLIAVGAAGSSSICSRSLVLLPGFTAGWFEQWSSCIRSCLSMRSECRLITSWGWERFLIHCRASRAVAHAELRWWGVQREQVYCLSGVGSVYSITVGRADRWHPGLCLQEGILRERSKVFAISFLLAVLAPNYIRGYPV